MAVSAGDVISKIPLIQWKVDISFLDNTEAGDYLISPIFSSINSHNGSVEKWQLVLYPKGVVEEDKDYLGIFLKHLTNQSETRTRIDFWLLNNNNVKVKYCPVRVTFKSSEDEWGRRRFFEDTFIRDPSENIIDNNKITFMCKVIIVNMNLEENENENKKYLSRLKVFDRFEKLLASKQFSDVTITAEGKYFHLHKCILVTCSDVFQAMFTNDMKEKNQNIVEIEDVRYEVLQELFRFAYTGNVNNVEKIVGELLTAAEKYCIEGLKLLCEEKMSSYLNVNNSIEYLNLAVMNNAEHLKANAIKFVSLYLEVISEKEEFDDFGKQNPELLLKIIKKYIHE